MKNIMNMDGIVSDYKEEESKWIPIKTVGPSPGMRYGHTLAFLKPFFIMFGGNTNSNDVWIIDINAVQVSWIKLDFPNGTGPCPRLYHTVGFCSKGGAQGMMIVFGGRDSTDNPLNDIWGLRRHRDGRWDWILATISKGDKLKPRYNHSVVFYGTLMIIFGGRARKYINAKISLEKEYFVEETQKSFPVCKCDDILLYFNHSESFEAKTAKVLGIDDSRKHDRQRNCKSN